MAIIGNIPYFQTNPDQCLIQQPRLPSSESLENWTIFRTIQSWSPSSRSYRRLKGVQDILFVSEVYDVCKYFRYIIYTELYDIRRIYGDLVKPNRRCIEIPWNLIQGFVAGCIFNSRNSWSPAERQAHSSHFRCCRHNLAIPWLHLCVEIPCTMDPYQFEHRRRTSIAVYCSFDWTIWLHRKTPRSEEKVWTSENSHSHGAISSCRT